MPNFVESYRIIIQGKSVEFVIEAEEIKLPKFGYFERGVIKDRSRKTRNAYIRAMIEGYLRQDINGFFNYARKVVEQKFIELLQQHPNWITPDNFKVHITYNFLGARSVQAHRLAGYNASKSSIGDIYFEMDVSSLVLLISYNNENEIEKTIIHEFSHHLDEWDRKENLSKKIMELATKDGCTFSVNSFFIFMYFNELRNEGISQFDEELKTSRKIHISPRPIKKLIELLEKFCTEFGADSVIKEPNEVFLRYLLIEVIKRFEATTYTYKCGAMMVSIIVLYNLFKNNKRFSVWIIPKFVLIGKRDYNAEEIRKFYGKRSFELYFSDRDSKIDTIIDEAVNNLRSDSHIQFLKEYEEACNYFGIKEQFFNLKTYNYYKKKCWENYRKFVNENRNKKEISRREFTKLSLQGLAIGTLATSSGGSSIIKATKRKKISFQEALQNPNLRQEYINQIVESIGKPSYTEFVTYDHGSSKAKEDYVNRAFIDRRRLEKIINWLNLRQINSIERFLGYPISKGYLTYGQIVSYISKLSKSADGKSLLIKIFTESVEIHHPFNEGDYGYTDTEWEGFGNRELSRIYIFGSVFNKKCIFNKRELVKELHPSEEVVISTIIHEFKHAEQFYKGIILNNKLFINNAKGLRRIVKEFLIETDASLHSLFVYTKNLGPNNHAYLHDMYDLAELIKMSDALRSSTKLTDYERKIVDFQMAILEKIIPDIINIFGDITLTLKKC